MAKVIIGHHPELTPQDAMKVFERHFAGKYEVYMNKSRFLLPGKHFVVKKSAWTAAAFSLKQTKDETVFTFIVTAPSVVRRLIGVAFLGIWALASHRAYKKMEHEMKSFIDSAEEFR